MTDEERKKMVDEISELEKCKYAIAESFQKTSVDAFEAFIKGETSIDVRPVTPEDLFGDNISSIEYRLFYEVERAQYRDEPGFDNPRYYWCSEIKSQEEADALFSKAKEGDVDAQLKLGQAHYSAGNFEAALDWFEKAALTKESDALVRLGELYMEGKGTDKNPAKAIWAYEMAIVIDANCDALESLGECYLEGNGVNKETNIGLSYLERAARQGLCTAMVFLGNLYQCGIDVNRDLDEAEKWFSMAAMGYSTAGYNNLMEVYREKENYEYMKIWSRLYMKMGNPRAFHNVGVMLYRGEGMAEDKNRAMELIRQAADMDDPFACYGLSKLLKRTDEDQSWEYFKKAFGLGLREAMFEMGTYLWNDARDQAVEYIREAAAKGHGPAIAFLQEHGL